MYIVVMPLILAFIDVVIGILFIIFCHIFYAISARGAMRKHYTRRGWAEISDPTEGSFEQLATLNPVGRFLRLLNSDKL